GAADPAAQAPPGPQAGAGPARARAGAGRTGHVGRLRRVVARAPAGVRDPRLRKRAGRPAPVAVRFSGVWPRLGLRGGPVRASTGHPTTPKSWRSWELAADLHKPVRVTARDRSPICREVSFLPGRCPCQVPLSPKGAVVTERNSTRAGNRGTTRPPPGT